MSWRDERTNCKGPHCRARILWLRHARTGKRMCFEAEPITEADALAEPRGVFFRTESGDVLGWGPEVAGWDVGQLYRSHWGECPDRGLFRKAAA